MLKNNLPEAKTVSLWEIYDRLGLPEDSAYAENPGTLAVHDACATRHEKQVHESVRRILKKLHYAIEELRHTGEKTECCGYGGLMCFANPELATQVADRRIGRSGVDYLTYCAMCRDRFAARGKGTLHIWI